MLSQDDFQYALENTKLLLAPRRRIATFGTTTFRFQLVTELMDRANEVRVRAGAIHAARPQIVTPEHYAQLLLEGFGARAQRFVDWLREQPAGLVPAALALRYGFQVRRSEVTETLWQLPLEEVTARLRAEAERADDPLATIVQGVDDAWEVCLLKLTLDLVRGSSDNNLGDLRQRGWL